MRDLIQSEAIPGSTVYGVQQVQYTVDGAPDKDYTAATTLPADVPPDRMVAAAHKLLVALVQAYKYTPEQAAA